MRLDGVGRKIHWPVAVKTAGRRAMFVNSSPKVPRERTICIGVS